VSHQEKWNAHAGKRQDLFGFIDILGIHPDREITLGIQCTVQGHMRERFEKIKEECLCPALDWLRAGNRIQIHGWQKMKPRGGAPYRRVRVYDVFLVDDGRLTVKESYYTYSKKAVPGHEPWADQVKYFFSNLLGRF
jgi:hypothetical protein